MKYNMQDLNNLSISLCLSRKNMNFSFNWVHFFVEQDTK